eukprot:gnl/Spiro4/13953_TR7468_c0_g1_i1.p1 gnl/Spiro4/13953_TR7468_c0_g1~~gnl/Spiro4/13953_TR7468_c0_g1_i1.p1  ORF type:complete len:367 (+),score=21.18 gnl/Spiro4/13953_TR7468_c0_g1_i1:33-1103(+)
MVTTTLFPASHPVQPVGWSREHGLPPAPPAFPPTLLHVSNISSAVNLPTLQAFFGACGPLAKCIFADDGSGPSRIALVEYKLAENAQVALLLDGTPLGILPLQITTMTTSVQRHRQFSFGIGYDSTSQVATAGRSREFDGTHSSGPKTEIARTVYVGNLASNVTLEQLTTHLSVCGDVAYVRLAGDDTHSTRYGFVEFETEVAANIALTLNGSFLVGRAVKISHSKNPIMKAPQPQSLRVTKQTLYKVSDAQAAINARLGLPPPENAIISSRSRSSSDKSIPNVRRPRSRSGSRSRSPSPKRARRHHTHSRSRSPTRSDRSRTRTVSPERDSRRSRSRTRTLSPDCEERRSRRSRS